MSDISTKMLVKQLKTLLREGIQGPNKLGGVIGAIAHVAYHLGAIRQKLAESNL